MDTMNDRLAAYPSNISFLVFDFFFPFLPRMSCSWCPTEHEIELNSTYAAVLR